MLVAVSVTISVARRLHAYKLTHPSTHPHGLTRMYIHACKDLGMDTTARRTEPSTGRVRSKATSHKPKPTGTDVIDARAHTYNRARTQNRTRTNEPARAQSCAMQQFQHLLIPLGNAHGGLQLHTHHRRAYVLCTCRFDEVLNASDSIDSSGGVVWKVVVSLFGAWVIVALCEIKGIQSAGYVV